MISQSQFQAHKSEQFSSFHFTDTKNTKESEFISNSCQFSDLTLKFTKSLAQTCEADSDRRQSQIEDQVSERSCISITKFQIQSDVNSENDVCEQFHEKGYCFNGVQCLKNHLSYLNEGFKIDKKKVMLKWILQEIPELLLDCKTGRISNFLQ